MICSITQYVRKGQQLIYILLGYKPMVHASMRATITPAHLVRIQLDKNVGHTLVILGIVLADSVHCIWHILEH